MLNDILAISGKSGLFKLISSSQKVVIVESLADGKRTQIRSDAKVISLGDISIYTNETEVPLKDVLKQMKENAGGKAEISHKESDDKIKAVIKKAIPNYDESRVYMSDMRKIVLWYNQLVEKDMLNFDKEEETNAEETKEETKSTAMKPASKKSATAKTVVPKSNVKSAKAAPKPAVKATPKIAPKGA